LGCMRIILHHCWHDSTLGACSRRWLGGLTVLSC
jgi:hypothetical protein